MPNDPAYLQRYNRKQVQIKPTPIVNAINQPKIILPPYNGQTISTSYPINQKQETPLTPTVDDKKENLLKKYPQILLLIPLMIIILSKK